MIKYRIATPDLRAQAELAKTEAAPICVFP